MFKTRSDSDNTAFGHGATRSAGKKCTDCKKNGAEDLTGKRQSLACSIIFILASIAITHVGAQQATVYVFPASYTVSSIGLPFTVNISIQNVNNLYGYEFKLYYPNDFLNGTSVTDGPFLKTGNVSTFFYISQFTDAYNETHGLVNVFCLRLVDVGVDGNGVLTTITFNSTLSSSPEILHLVDVKLSDPDAQPIPCTTLNGEVSVVPEFPTAFFLLFLMVLTSMLIVLRKTVRPNTGK